jgi:hypothetical protein
MRTLNRAQNLFGVDEAILVSLSYDSRVLFI